MSADHGEARAREAEAKDRAATRFARERLPGGHRRLSAATVAENQRWRLFAAAEAFYRRGYLGTTSKPTATIAGLSSSAFLWLLRRRLRWPARAAFDVAVEALLRALADRCQELRSGVYQNLEALLAFCRAEPQVTGLLGTELTAAGKGIAPLRWQLTGHLGALLEERGESARQPRTLARSAGISPPPRWLSVLTAPRAGTPSRRAAPLSWPSCLSSPAGRPMRAQIR
jgi:hypothetical protein